MSAIRFHFALLVFVSFQASATSQEDKEFRHLKLNASAEPVPILKYQFYRPIHELRNESPDEYFEEIAKLHQSLSDEDLTLIDQFRKNSLEGLGTPNKGLLSKKSFQALLEPIHGLAMCSFEERQITFAVEPEFYWTTELPQLTIARDAAYILRSNIESSGSLEERIAYITDGIRLAEYVGEGATILHKYTGYAIYGAMLNSIESAIVDYQDVNLYWAMASIPRPLIRHSDALRMEFHVILNCIEELREENVKIPGKDNEFWIDQYNKVTETILKLPDEQPSSDEMAILEIHLLHVESVKQQLVACGLLREELDEMPPAQVIMLGVRQSLVNVCQELERLAYLDTYQLAFVSAQEELILKRFHEECEKTFSPAGVIFALLNPHVSGALESTCRFESRLHKLMTIEAIRLHAFRADILPQSLNDLVHAPAYKHPVTGNHFDYEVNLPGSEGQTFNLLDSVEVGGYSGASYRVDIRFSITQ